MTPLPVIKTIWSSMWSSNGSWSPSRVSDKLGTRRYSAHGSHPLGGEDVERDDADASGQDPQHERPEEMEIPGRQAAHREVYRHRGGPIHERAVPPGVIRQQHASKEA